MGQKKLDILSDIVFKAVFGREETQCKQVLMDLLNAILSRKGKEQIREMTYQNPFNLQAVPKEKLTVMDIKVKTEAGEWIDIEMQMKSEPIFRNRSLFYWSELYHNSFSAEMPYSQLKKCIVINILTNMCIRESEKYHTQFGVLEREEHFALTDHLEMHFIELHKLNKMIVAEMSDMNNG